MKQGQYTSHTSRIGLWVVAILLLVLILVATGLIDFGTIGSSIGFMKEAFSP